MACIGAGAGLTIFAVMGLLPYVIRRRGARLPLYRFFLALLDTAFARVIS